MVEVSVYCMVNLSLRVVFGFICIINVLYCSFMLIVFFMKSCKYNKIGVCDIFLI